MCYQRVGDEGAIAFTQMLHKNQRMDTIDLFGNIVSEGVVALREAIAFNSITVLNGWSNTVSDDACRDLECALVLNREPLFLEKYIPKLRDNDPEVGAFRCVIALSSLSKNPVVPSRCFAPPPLIQVCCLQLHKHHSCRYYDDVSARLLCDAIRHNTHITSLNLSNNRITAVGARLLADALRTNTGLRMLNLNHNQVGSEGAQYLSDALEVNSSLVVLKLSNNDVDDDGGERLAKALEGNRSLMQLNLSFNPKIKEAGHPCMRASRRPGCSRSWR